MDGLVSSDDQFGGPVFHQLGKNDIAVVVVDDEHVVVAARGWKNKAARDIAEDLASDGAAVGEDMMGAAKHCWLVKCFRWEEVVRERGINYSDGNRSSLGAALMGALLVEVAKCSDARLEEMTADRRGGEARPSGLKTGGNGF